VKTSRDIAVYISITVCFIFIACGTVASVKPLGAGNRSLIFSAGGPVAPVYGIKMPLPYSVFRYRSGLNDNTDAHVGFHPTMALFGNIGLDIGLTKHFARNCGLRPGISAGMSLYGFYDLSEARNARLYPELSVILTYDVSRRVPVIYLGVENMIQFTEPYLVPACLLGGEFVLSKRLALSLEARWYAPNESGDDRVVDYSITPFGQGAFGFVFGFAYTFGRRQS
jgi:hypothetical protein